MSALAAPKAVSPLIRFSRYALLASGFVYGTWRFNHLAKKETALQAEYEQIRVKRDARLRAEKELAVKAEMDTLGKECGIASK